jgi:hypothetical protein
MYPAHSFCCWVFIFDLVIILDVMLDDQLKPWIIEVNASPAIAISGAVDTRVKIPLLNDMLEAIGFGAEAGEIQKESRQNVLSPGQIGYDAGAQKRADAASVAAAHAAAAHAAAASSNGVIVTPVTGNGIHSTISGRSDKVQRVPRLVKLQSMGNRANAGTAVNISKTTPAVSAAAAVTATPVRSSRTRPPPSIASSMVASISSAVDPTSLIPPLPLPRMPAGASPSKIPIRMTSVTTHDPINSTSIKSIRPRVSLAPTGAKVSATMSAPRRSTLTNVIPVVNSVSNVRPTPTRTRISSAPNSISSSSNSSASTADLPTLIGDFERIFPFDSVTANISDTLRSSAHTQVQPGKGISASASNGTPTPLIIGDFIRTVTSRMKLRIRSRDRIHQERQNACKLDPSLSIRQSFVDTSDIPSPWTSDVLDAAVDRAKRAAMNERIRLKLPEPTTQILETDE